VAKADVRALPTARSRRRRDDLLIAARQVFEEHGYFETKVADIARLASASHGTFYTYFDSKDDVLRALVAELADDLYVAATQPVGHHATPFLTLQATIRQFMHAYRDRAAMLRILEQATSVSDEFLAVRLQIRDRFARGLEAVLRARLARDPDPDGLDPALAAYALGGMAEDFARGRYVLGQLLDDDAGIATLTVIWARAIRLPTR
jgi:AcrR family transcriptional regulator